MSVPSPLLTHLRVCRRSYSRPATLTRSLRCAAAPNSQTARAPLAPLHADPRIASPPRALQYLTCGNVSACRLRTPGCGAPTPLRMHAATSPGAYAGPSSSSSSSSAASSSSSSAATEPLILRLSVPVEQRKPVCAVARFRDRQLMQPTSDSSSRMFAQNMDAVTRTSRASLGVLLSFAQRVANDPAPGVCVCGGASELSVQCPVRLCLVRYGFMC